MAGGARSLAKARCRVCIIKVFSSGPDGHWRGIGEANGFANLHHGEINYADAQIESVEDIQNACRFVQSKPSRAGRQRNWRPNAVAGSVERDKVIGTHAHDITARARAVPKRRAWIADALLPQRLRNRPRLVVEMGIQVLDLFRPRGSV